MTEKKTPRQEPAPENDAACGPGCNCQKQSVTTRAKAAVCVVVLIAVCIIVAYKITTATQSPADNAVNAFAIPTKSVEDKKQVGEFLDSLSSLNTVAVNQDTVFVFVPGKGATAAAEATASAIQSAKSTLESKGIRIGFYSLRSNAPEYAKIAAQLSLPGLLVMTKGRGVAAVSGDITETKLLQAYVASSRAGGCGSSGCGPSSSECQ